MYIRRNNRYISRIMKLTCILCIFCSHRLNAQIHIHGSIIDDLGTRLPSVNLTFFLGTDSLTTNTNENGVFSFDLFTDASSISHARQETWLSDNYPNPFNQVTQLSVFLPAENRVTLQVLTIEGHPIGSPIRKRCNQGFTDFQLELPGLPDGIYLVRCIIGNASSITKKISLCRNGSSQKAEALAINRENRLLKALSTIHIDSLTVRNRIIGKNTFTNLPPVIYDTLTLDNWVVERFCPECPTVEWEGKIYHTVKIGSQCWLRENLNNGEMISVLENQKNNQVLEKYCFNNDELYICNKYGGLYQWAEAVQYHNGASLTRSPSPPFTGPIKGICPDGWHIPSLYEWQKLSETVDHNGNALKLAGEGYDLGIGTNISGFSALLAGPRGSENFGYEGNQTDFWTSTEADDNNAFLVTLVPQSGTFFLNTVRGKKYGFSIRCIKD